MTKKFDKEKIEKAQEAVEAICLHCGEKHLTDCNVNRARAALRTLAEIGTEDYAFRNVPPLISKLEELSVKKLKTD